MDLQEYDELRSEFLGNLKNAMNLIFSFLNLRKILKF